MTGLQVDVKEERQMLVVTLLSADQQSTSSSSVTVELRPSPAPDQHEVRPEKTGEPGGGGLGDPH